MEIILHHKFSPLQIWRKTTESESKELFLAIAQSEDRHVIRNRAIFLTAKYCALRVSEIGLLSLSDYDMEKHQIYCHRKKGSYNNTIRIIDPDVCNALDAH